MNSVLVANKLPRNRYMGWRIRLEEIQTADDARVKEITVHHCIKAVTNLSNIDRALDQHAQVANMSRSELRIMGKNCVHDAVGKVFRSWYVMDRLEPMFAAVRKLAGGTLPPELEGARQAIWQTLDKVEIARQHYLIDPAKQRHTIDLSDEIRLLRDEIEARILAAYSLAKSRYGLPEIVIFGKAPP